MNIRHLFGKPLPRALIAGNAVSLSWTSTLMLLAGAGLVTWVVVGLLKKDQQEVEEMLYFWPE